MQESILDFRTAPPFCRLNSMLYGGAVLYVAAVRQPDTHKTPQLQPQVPLADLRHAPLGGPPETS